MTIRRLEFSPFFSWVSKGSFAILDQGLFAGANFIMNILLARWFTSTQYGVFSFSFSLFLLLGSLHTAVLTEPMLVFGAGKYMNHFRKYLGVLIKGHMILMVPIILFIMLLALLVGRFYLPEAQGTLIWLAVAGPMILLLWLARRSLYVRVQPGWAALGAGFYLAILLGGIYLLHIFQWLSPATAFMSMGLGSILVGTAFIVYLHPQWKAEGDPEPETIAREHWGYGRWAMGTGVLMCLPGSICFIILPSYIGLDGVAALRALYNVVLPVLHIYTALSGLLLPILAWRLRQDTAKFVRTVKLFLLLYLVGAAFYLLALYVSRTKVLNILYGGKYLEFSSLILTVGLLPFASSLVAILGSALRAMERPNTIFYCYAASGIVALFGGVGMARVMGVQGALLGWFCSSLTAGGLMLAAFVRTQKKGLREFLYSPMQPAAESSHSLVVAD